MKHAIIFFLLLLAVSLAAFDLEYIKPVPLEDAKKETPPPDPPQRKTDPIVISSQSALQYVNSLNYKDYDRELLKNAYLGNTEVVEILLERDADPNYRLPGPGVSVLQAALFNNHADIANLLLDRGASSIQWDSFDRFGLCYAARTHGNLDLVCRIRQNTDLIYRDKLWRTAAIYAAVYENLEVLDWLAENYGPLSDYRDRGPAEYAAANNRLSILKQMRESRIVRWSPESALKYAIAAGAVEIVAYLLSLEETEPDASHLVIAALGEASFRNLDIPAMQVTLCDAGDYLFSEREPRKPDFVNTTENYQAIFRLLSTRVDVNARDEDGVTPLVACAMANDAAQAQTLLELGANPFLRHQGQTPLDIALANPDADPNLIRILKAAMK